MPTTIPKPINILIQFAHPHPRRSRANRALLAAVEGLEGVIVNDLYQIYPDFHIEVEREQALLREADLIVFQHPIYWYSAPALLKQWQDNVLEYGFAFGKGGDALHGKQLLSVVSFGHKEEDYRSDGYDQFTVAELLRPYQRTAAHCGMGYLPPLAFFRAHKMTETQQQAAADSYRARLAVLREQLGGDHG